MGQERRNPVVVLINISKAQPEEARNQQRKFLVAVDGGVPVDVTLLGVRESPGHPACWVHSYRQRVRDGRQILATLRPEPS